MDVNSPPKKIRFHRFWLAIRKHSEDSVKCFCNIHLCEKVFRHNSQYNLDFGLSLNLHIILCLDMDDLWAKDFWQNGHLMSSRNGLLLIKEEESVNEGRVTWKRSKGFLMLEELLSFSRWPRFCCFCCCQSVIFSLWKCFGNGKGYTELQSKSI